MPEQMFDRQGRPFVESDPTQDMYRGYAALARQQGLPYTPGNVAQQGMIDMRQQGIYNNAVANAQRSPFTQPLAAPPTATPPPGFFDPRRRRLIGPESRTLQPSPFTQEPSAPRGNYRLPADQAVYRPTAPPLPPRPGTGPQSGLPHPFELPSGNAFAAGQPAPFTPWPSVTPAGTTMPGGAFVPNLSITGNPWRFGFGQGGQQLSSATAASQAALNPYVPPGGWQEPLTPYPSGGRVPEAEGYGYYTPTPIYGDTVEGLQENRQQVEQVLGRPLSAAEWEQYVQYRLQQASPFTLPREAAAASSQF